MVVAIVATSATTVCAQAHPSDELLSASAARLDYNVNPISVANASVDCSGSGNDPAEATLLCSVDRIEELSAQIDNSSQEHAICRKKLADSILDRNDSIQESASLKGNIERMENEIERMERAYSRTLNETYAELDRLEEQVAHQKRQIKSTEDRYQNTHRKLMEANDHLRQMHASAVNQYMNFTLMQEDARNSIERTFTRVTRRLDRRWGRQYRKLRPSIQDAKRKWYRFCREADSSLRPQIMAYKRKAEHNWAKSETVRPLLDMSWKAVMEAYGQYEPAVEEVKVAWQLSVLSLIEESSKIALSYLEKEDRMKEEQSQRSKSALEKHLEKKRRNRRDTTAPPPREKNSEPSLVNLKAREFFKYTTANSKKLYLDGIALLPLAFALSVSRCGFIGCIMFFWGIPTPLIWTFALLRFIARFIRSREKKAG